MYTVIDGGQGLSKFSLSKSVKENLVKVFLDKVNYLCYQSFLATYTNDGKYIKI